MAGFPCRLPAALLILAFSAATAFSAEVPDDSDSDAPRYTLRYRFHPGERIRWESVHRKKVDTTVSGVTQTIETSSKSVKVWRIVDVTPEGMATFHHSVENVDMWNRLGDSEEVRYNSQTDQDPPPGFEHLAQSVGTTLSVVTISARGEILQRDRKPAQAAAKSEGQMTIPFPEEPIPVGHAWTVPHNVDIQLESGMHKRVRTRQRFTLRSVKTGIATVEVATQILTPIDDPVLQTQLIQCESRGTVRFDIDAGRVISQRMDVDKQVVGYPNLASSFHYLTRFTETLLPAETETASR